MQLIKSDGEGETEANIENQSSLPVSSKTVLIEKRKYSSRSPHFLMAPSSNASDSATSMAPPNRAISFIQNAKKRKHHFIQFFAMTGILLLSIRSLGQKYRIYELKEDTHALQEEEQSLKDRMKNIKSSLWHEATQDSNGAFAARLRALFGGIE